MHLVEVAVSADRDLFEWGGPDVDGRTARLDAAFEAYEERHRGPDQAAHHRPYSPPADDDPPMGLPSRALLYRYARLLGLDISGVGHEPGYPG